ncbi:hypothetical protein RNJ44_02468 [Nakaseomyces bracarensis]|uniref:T6SS Phospholipase effector Tle1-like catalytic domain-containing protein n=1 Tax=Nakaseomyces bracarensis TaxID=273131 RepID=A0ABR4NLT0_9SACH
MKNIVLCFDGTSENFGPYPFSNVLKLYRMLECDESQLCYYQPGIGVTADCDPVTDLRRRFTWSSVRNMVDSMFAFSIESHIVEAYRYLMINYCSGDTVYMFGFSRGAYIARVLAGMIEKVGMLKPGQVNLVQMAWKVYVKWEYERQPIQPNYTTTLVDEFKKTFSRKEQIIIHFQGLFDSVNSVGIFRDKLFPCTQRCRIVKHIRHTLSLDERRGKFKQFCIEPTLKLPKRSVMSFHHEHITDTHPNSAVKVVRPHLIFSLNKGYRFLKGAGTAAVSFVTVHGYFKFDQLEDQNITESQHFPDVIEMWFPGDHADVGGGWALDADSMESTSNMSLRWIIGEAIKFGCRFDMAALKNFADQSTSVGTLFADTHDYLKLSITRHDIRIENSIERFTANSLDLMALAHIRGILKAGYEKKLYNAIARNELLVKAKYGAKCGNLKKIYVLVWWLLELIPIGLRVQKDDGTTKDICFPNLGSYRYVPEYGRLHWSVYWKIRFSQNYRPPNIPDYARHILHDLAGITLKPAHVRTSCTAASHNSMGNSSSCSTLMYRGKDPIIKQTSHLSVTSTLLNETLSERVAHETREMVLEWMENGWRHVPDDLERYLSTVLD